MKLPAPLNASAVAAAGPSDRAPAPAVDTPSAIEHTLRQAAQRFEGYFIGQMLQQMRHGTAVLADADSAINDRANADMLDLADQSLGDSLSQQRAFGIADALVRQLLPATGTVSTVDAAADNTTPHRKHP